MFVPTLKRSSCRKTGMCEAAQEWNQTVLPLLHLEIYEIHTCEWVQYTPSCLIATHTKDKAKKLASLPVTQFLNSQKCVELTQNWYHIDLNYMVTVEHNLVVKRRRKFAKSGR